MRRVPYLPLALLALAACGSSTSPDGGADASSVDAGAADAGSTNIAVIGAWDDDYGNTDLNCAGDGGTVPAWCYWAINDMLWGEDTVVSYDNMTGSCVTQEYAFSPYGPGTYNKIFWTAVDNGGFWWCNSTYGQTTYNEALTSSIAVDPTSPWDGGCPVATDGGDSFAWTYMTRHSPDIGILGDWRQADGGALDITDTTWGADSVVWYANPTGSASGWAVTKTISDAGTATYNLLEWTPAPAYCAKAVGLTSAAAAQGAVSADGGCTMVSIQATGG